MASLTLDRLGKSFGAGRAVDDVSLTVQPGAFLALLGPSGCGKTTLLRLVAGLERPTAGAIRIGERVVCDDRSFVEPEARGLGMVFQSYALWPHMSVAGNVGFGLKVQGLTPAERRRRVAAALETVGLGGYGARRPAELSGGQRQRVALARCLALEPPLILLDEPLANLDAHLRGAMQREFRRIHRESGTTFVYVTHDQSEAMALADRIAVLDRGRLQQIASPTELWRAPANAMVAGFIGGAAMLPVDVVAVEPDGTRRITLAGQVLAVPGLAEPGAGLLALRPADVELLPIEAARASRLPTAVVTDSVYRGDGFVCDLRVEGLADAPLQAVATAALEPGAAVGLRLRGGWVVPASDGG
ncbi:ABC transporter ATP-binding protein [Mangrovibrevibacter kandeliae]|uniref:ABC transporter ATP-binding protein n=1 Tax=Mangrovibrevibacter kandeliae TaxID=2968473 RepID=UPI002118B899|nr:ABC transporter ATP-binding protein [Aurantimonas sp. CSK15Z-1]MCQ8783121.1 ABC transporter ATP-binding protein [Aurantimonas sp. CSK15Z-1]